MENSTLIIISCIGLVLLILALFYYFNKKMIYQLTALESLQNQIFEQHKMIERHDLLLKQLFGNFTNPMTTPPMGPPAVPKQEEPPRINPILQVAPMVSSLLGALNSIKEEDEEPIIDEEEINNELKKELEELKVPEIREGRVDEARDMKVDSS